MRSFLDRFILGFPVLFLKQYPYAWIAVIVLWQRTPSFAGIFLAIIVIGMLSLRWQSAAWISHMRREHAPSGEKFHIDQPPVPVQKVLRSIAFLLAGSIVIAFLLKDRFGLGFWQVFLMLVGFIITYQDTKFFGAAVTYIIASTGIGIRFVPGHIDYRVFLTFDEIRHIERTRYQPDQGWDIFARTRDAMDGLLLTPKDPNGFSRRIEKVFIVPQDMEKFLGQLPQGLTAHGLK